MNIKINKSVYESLTNNGLECWNHKKYNLPEGGNENCLFCLKDPNAYKAFGDFIYNVGVKITKQSEENDMVEVSLKMILLPYMMSAHTMANIYKVFIGEEIPEYGITHKSLIIHSSFGVLKYISKIFETDVNSEYNTDIFCDYDNDFDDMSRFLDRYNKLNKHLYNLPDFINKMKSVRVINDSSFIKYAKEYTNKYTKILNKNNSILENYSKDKYTFNIVSASNYLHKKMFKNGVRPMYMILEVFLNIMKSRYEFDSPEKERIELTAMLLQLLDLKILDKAWLVVGDSKMISYEFYAGDNFDTYFLFNIKYVYAGIWGFYRILREEAEQKFLLKELLSEEEKIRYVREEYKNRIHKALACISSYIHTHKYYECVVNDIDIDNAIDYFKYLPYDAEKYIEDKEFLYDKDDVLLENIYNYTRTRDI